MKNILSRPGMVSAENSDGRAPGERPHPGASANSLTRRRAIAGAVIAVVAGLAANSEARADNPPPPATNSPDAAANNLRTDLHQEVDFKASPQRLYEVLLDSKQFAAFTKMPAEIDAKAGGAFTMFGGMILGRNVELIPAVRLVQAWRPAHWDPGIYSIVRFEFKPQGAETRIILDHTGFPAGEYDHLFPGWKLRYWDPMKKFLAA